MEVGKVLEHVRPLRGVQGVVVSLSVIRVDVEQTY
jgi:hypothetical protein